MSLSNTANFLVRRANNSGIVHGLVSSPAVRGLIMVHTELPDGTFLLTPATGKRGFHLERDAVAEWDLKDSIFTTTFFQPQKVDTVFSARKCEEIEAEGVDLVLTSGTGAISSNTALHTEISTHDGKLSVRQNGEELYGYLRGFPPVIGDGSFRIMVEVVQ